MLKSLTRLRPFWPGVCLLAMAVGPSGGKAQSVVVAWGDNSIGQTNVPTGLTNVVGIAAGFYHNLALRNDGTVTAWGGESGQTNVPAGLSNVVAIAAGDLHSLALRGDGTVFVWGDNSYGQTNVPSGLSNVVAIAGGGYHSLALRADGAVVGWGANFCNQSDTPPQAANLIAVSSRDATNLALREDGSVVAWGGCGGFSVLDVTNIVATSCGTGNNLLLKSDGTVIGIGLESPADITNAVDVAAGYQTGMALLADGRVVVWGNNSHQQTNIPPNLTNVTAIANGVFHCIALSSSAPQTALLSPAVSHEKFSTSAFAQRGQHYRLEYKNSPTDTWWNLLTAIPGDNSLKTLTHNSSIVYQRFYRVRILSR